MSAVIPGNPGLTWRLRRQHDSPGHEHKLPKGTVAVASSTGIFISYRRKDSSHLAGRISDRLTDHFGDRVFLDVDTIFPGADFLQAIEDAIAQSRVLLLIIGPNWVNISDEHGHRRLDDPSDYVRLEIEAALARSIVIIPVLTDGARMPRPDELPPELRELARRNAVSVRHEGFGQDMLRLTEALEAALGGGESGPNATRSVGRAGPTTSVEATDTGVAAGGSVTMTAGGDAVGRDKVGHRHGERAP